MRLRSDLIQYEDIESMWYQVGERHDRNVHISHFGKRSEQAKINSNKALVKSYHPQTRFPK